MKHKKQIVVIALLALVVTFIQCSKAFEKVDEESASVRAGESANSEKKSLIADGKQIFRFDTFGDEDFWSG